MNKKILYIHFILFNINATFDQLETDIEENIEDEYEKKDFYTIIDSYIKEFFETIPIDFNIGILPNNKICQWIKKTSKDHIEKILNKIINFNEKNKFNYYINNNYININKEIYMYILNRSKIYFEKLNEQLNETIKNKYEFQFDNRKIINDFFIEKAIRYPNQLKNQFLLNMINQEIEDVIHKEIKIFFLNIFEQTTIINVFFYKLEIIKNFEKKIDENLEVDLHHIEESLEIKFMHYKYPHLIKHMNNILNEKEKYLVFLANVMNEKDQNNFNYIKYR